MRELFSSAVKAAVTCTMFVLCACGGGGSTSSSTSGTPVVAATTISGVAAAGAPIIGFAYLKDGAGVTKGPVSIAADGSFSFDVTGLTAPFMLEAKGAAGGQSFTLDSVTTTTGTANINPLTNLVAAQALGGQTPTEVFNSSAPVDVKQSDVDAAITAMRTALAPLLAAANVADSTTIQNFDPIKTTYIANPATNKLDAMFDAVTIAVAAPASTGASATVSVTDKGGNVIMPATSATTTAVTSAAATVAGATSTISGVSQTATDSPNIIAFLQSWANTINAKGTSLATTDLDPYYIGSASNIAPYGVQNGASRPVEIANLVKSLDSKIIPTLGQCKGVSNFAILNDVTKNNGYLDDTGAPLYNKVYRISADFVFQDGSFGNPGHLTVAQQVANGPWLFIGDNWKADIDVTPYANEIFRADGTVVFKSGLNIKIDDVGSANINSASLEGPGLPMGGVTLSKTSNGGGSVTRLALDASFTGYPFGDTWGQFEMKDAGISMMQPATMNAYTLKLYSGATAPTDHSTGLVQTIHPTIGSAPVATADLAAAYFGTFSIAGMTHQLSSLTALASPVTVGYMLPTKYAPAWAEFDVNVWSNQSNTNYSFNQQLTLNATTTTVITSTTSGATFNSGMLGLQIQDVAQRTFNTYWELQ
jgi:hypothetical protein